MKAYIIGLSLIAIVLVSCKKSGRTDPDSNPGKKYKLHLNVSGFSQEITDIETEAASNHKTAAVGSLKDVANKLYYLIYNSSYKLVADVRQTSAMANFGQVTNSFSPGTYYIAVIAGKDYNYLVNPDLYNEPDIYKDYAKSFITDGHDTFFKKTTFTITNSDVDQNITLDRIVGQLQIKLTDAIPAEVKFIILEVDSDFPRELPTGRLMSEARYQVKRIFDIANTPGSRLPGYLMTTYISNLGRSLTVTISAYDNAGKIASTTVSVKCAANTRTLLTGALFKSGTSGFNAMFNETWDATPYVTIPF